MSRNLRHKSNATPAKKTVRRSSTATEMSNTDDDYAGVDAISDSDEDEPDVEEVEEQAIIESFTDPEDEDSQSTPRPAIDDDQSTLGDFDLEEEEILGADLRFFDDHIARGHAPDLDTEAALLSSINRLSEDEKTRRVRFDVADSSSNTSDNEESLFPDIFVEQGSLDPSFRRAIERKPDDDDDNGSSDGDSYWDWNGEEPLQPLEKDVASQIDNDEEDESTSSVGSSGYETDDGETTEEDLPPAARYINPSLNVHVAARRNSVLRHESSDSDSDFEEEITLARRASFRNANGPKLGSWVSDRTKPFLVMDNKINKLRVYRAKLGARRFSFSGTSNRPQLGSLQESESEAQVEQLSPMISNSANLMMSAMYNPIDQLLMGGHALGPPEAFFPFTNINADGTIGQDSPESYDDDEIDVDDEDLWSINDFLSFGGESDNGDEDEDDDNMIPSSTPARPTTAISEDQVHPLLANPSLVGAFRKNQNQHQLLTRNKASRESLAFSGPLNQGTLRGIKGNRLSAANTPITPMRKQKGARANLPSSPASPLVQQQQKRKFSGEQTGHKRTRSLV